ncbi:DnaJ domain [Trypanosoma vivax]|uniref:J domain-containing protein n=1 Tax=Trypanosoma vivax (strain Y486) TaxID=1055687 RepID=G0U8Q5_TRYVY|nr:DnaJ domain [Trypanosoma vivax]CCC53983.1 conserved hypothetical protein [Trypanosoma vivax Y486]
MWRLRSALARTSRCSVRGVFQTKAFIAASKSLPSTPEGRNPYDVLEITVTDSTSLNDVSRQFRDLVVRNHPDQPGGSHEKMSELNAAYQIVKEHHNAVIQRLKECEAEARTGESRHPHRSARSRSDEKLGRSSGVFRRNAKTMEQTAAPRRARSLQEIESAWAQYKEDAGRVVSGMCNRYELAVEKGCFFRKTSMLNDITVRERWLRKTYIKSMWEEVHELRGELLRRGARSSQQSKLAEEMVAFASSTQRKLNDDFQRLTQMSMHSQSHLFLQRLLFALLTVVLFVKFWQYLLSGLSRNLLTVRFRQGILGY